MTCQCCGKNIGNDGFCVWHGAPFSIKADRELCYTCLSTIKPISSSGVAWVGTSSNDIYSLAEMIEDGFDQARAAISIKKIGEVLGLPPKIIKDRLHLPKNKKPSKK